MTLTQLYLISILPNLGIFFFMVAGLGGLCLFSAAASYAKKERGSLPHLRKITASLLLCGLLGAAIPTERLVWLIMGETIVTNTQGVDKLPANIVAAMNNFLEKIQENNKGK